VDRLVLAAALLVTACFNPSFPDGLACSERDRCPPGLSCVAGVCRVEAGGAGGDAGANPDAEPEPECIPITADDPTCDGVDDDCDDSFDEDADFQRPFFRDRDGDGYGAGQFITACTQPPGHTDIGGDCWDADDPDAARAFPGQTEFVTMANYGGTVPFDWNCDGETEYQYTLCIDLQVQDDRCEDYSQSDGWINMFPDCGETTYWCTAWDIYKDGCYGGMQLTQGCR
jgi:hypothetical protein